MSNYLVEVEGYDGDPPGDPGEYCLRLTIAEDGGEVVHYINCRRIVILEGRVHFKDMTCHSPVGVLLPFEVLMQALGTLVPEDVVQWRRKFRIGHLQRVRAFVSDRNMDRLREQR